MSFVKVRLVDTKAGSGTIVRSITALAERADLGVYPIVFAMDTTEFLLTAESINASLDTICARTAL